MKRNFVVGLFGSFVGFGMLLILLSATGLVSAQGRSDLTCDLNSAGAGPASSLASTTFSNTFTYQGQLKNASGPVTGACDIIFGLYDNPNAGSPIGDPITATVSITNGLFTQALNFGANVFTGDARWLDLQVRCPAGSGSYTTLIPRQALTAAPYALALPGLWTQPNDISPNVIGGFSGNSIYSGAVGSVIGGGGGLSGGYANTISTSYAFIGGGINNSVGGFNSVIGGGSFNQTNQPNAVVGGGNGNQANAYYATVSGGYENVIVTGGHATISGGNGNNASGDYAAIPGGYHNIANGRGSFAAGQLAHANYDGDFVWSDDSGVATESSAVNQFVAHASNGFYFYPTSGGCTLATGAGGWSCSSDRNLKENFKAVDSQVVLQRLSQIPISRWNSVGQNMAIQHVGPMAQDFYAAFGLGEDNLHINTVDAQGIALAAIQGLYQIVQDKDKQITTQQQQIDNLQTQVSQLQPGTSSAPFNVFNLISVVALIGFVWTWLQQRRSKRGQA